MFKKAWIAIVILLITAKFNFEIYNGYMPSLQYEPWPYIFYTLCPLISLFVSIKAWHRSFVWRRMKALRQMQRGAIKPTSGTSFLEWASLAFCIFSLLTILAYFNVNHANWWLISVIGFLWALRSFLGSRA